MSLDVNENSFLYFGFASNLLGRRLLTTCPGARRRGIGMLKGYRLDFNYRSERWKGSMATLVKDDEGCVWGAIWEIPLCLQDVLDKKEGTGSGVYRALEVDVETGSGQVARCRAYQNTQSLEEDRRPSRVYKNVILDGARESGLPESYIEKLSSIEDNSYDGHIDWDLDLQHRQ